MMHPGPDPEKAGGDAQHVARCRAPPHSPGLPRRLQIPSLLFSPTSSWVKVAGHPLQGIWGPSTVYVKALCSSEQTQPELCGYVSTADMCSMICCDWTHHWARWCVLRLPLIPFPLEGPAPRDYPKTLLRTLIHCQEVGTCGVAPVGRQSWDQTKRCIKSCRYNCHCTNSHTNMCLQGVRAASEQQSNKMSCNQLNL